MDYTRCDCGRPTTITDQLGNLTKYTLGGPENDPTALTDANGHVTHFGYDAKGNFTTTTYADGSVDRVVDDALGNPSSLVNRRGQTITLTRNTAGQVTQETFPDSSSNSYTYDARGRLATATDSHGTTTFTYDQAGRLQRVDYPHSRWIQYTYDAAGRRSFMEDNSGFKVHYLYDAAGRLSELKDASTATETRIVLYTYDQAGRLQREDKGNGTYTTYSYDGAGRVASIVNRAPDNSINSRFDYTYDALGRRTSLVTLDGTWNYTYDLTGQLTHAGFASTNAQIPNQDLSYSYDALGNRIQTVLNGATTGYTTNNLNEYSAVGGTTNTYDLDGNLIQQTGSGGTRTYTYDALNRLTQAVTPQGTWQYEYDALSNRVATVFNGQRTEYLLDAQGQGSVEATYDGASNRTATYANGLGLEGTIVSGGWDYYDFDGLGSTAGISGAGGTYANSYAYDPFGATLLSTGTIANPFQFVGAAGVTAEGNGLDFMGARFYDLTLGRFDSPDPLRLGGADTNLYRYAGNDPVDIIDPAGTRWCWYGPWGQDPHVQGGPNHFFGFSFGESTGHSVGVGVGVGAGVTVGASAGIGPTAGVGVGGVIGPSVSVGPNAGIASAGIASAGVGAHAEIGAGVSAGLNASAGYSYGYNAGASFGYSQGSTNGWIFGWGDCPDPPPPPPPPPQPPGPSGDNGDSGTVQSQDPNGLVGPSGFGPQHYMPPASILPYRIDFENAATASAPAQRVVVTNQLSTNLDWNSFEFTDIGWGDTSLLAPPGSQHYENTVFMTFNAHTFNVVVVADLNPVTGLVTVSFQSIDPATQLPPDVLTGFLPPEDGTGRGQGHVSYLVHPKSGLPTGTAIRNVALIQFDANTIIATNQVDEHDPSQGTDPNKEALVTIDAVAPTSNVLPLTSPTATAQFLVQWTGQDDTGGSGLATFDIFVSDNGGPFTPFLTKTKATSATFTGQDGHTYGFDSVATDNVGLRQATPPAIQAFILVQLPSSGGGGGGGGGGTTTPPGSGGETTPPSGGGGETTPPPGSSGGETTPPGGGQTTTPPPATTLPVVIPFAPSTVGVFAPGTATWYLRDSNNPGAPDITPFAYGASGWQPVVGDWDGDGTTTIGVFDPTTATWYLKNSNSPGAPDIAPFAYGAPGWIPVVGDWDGDGSATIGVVDPTTMTWYLKNSNSPGAPDSKPFAYGASGWIPVVGDWDGDGTTTIGVVDPATMTWYLKNSNSPGAPDIAPFAYGGVGDAPIVGDWQGTGATTIGVFNTISGDWKLRNSNSPGAPDIAPFAYGAPGWTPVPGRFSAGVQLLLAAGGAGSGAAPISQTAVEVTVAGALDRLQQAGVNQAVLDRLKGVTAVLQQLPAGQLGVVLPQARQIVLSPDGAGYGWFVDATPGQDEEFADGLALPAGAADGREDLLTAVLHELAGLAGLAEDGNLLAAGQRHTQALDRIFAAAQQ